MDHLNIIKLTTIFLFAYNKDNGEEIKAKNLAIGQLLNTELEMYATALFNLATNYDNSFDLVTVDESIFIDLVLNPFIKAVVSFIILRLLDLHIKKFKFYKKLSAVLPINHKLQRSGHFTSLEGEENFKPDMKCYTTIDGIRFDCLLIEVKCPSSTCGDDLLKLSIEMQFILNRFVEHSANNPAVYGVLVYGFICSMYKITLVAPKVYVTMKIRKCFLPRCSEDFHVAINTLSSFSQLRDLVYEQVQLIAANKRKTSDILGWVRKPIMGIKQ
ncbi:MAG: hypothetical protein EXX96DRAFT_645714 [Benjaminiella poitrasii]|nr:MAG: hypothetical protein EXX96DRAFT_645714 [Benjaminiella poitrasii]